MQIQGLRLEKVMKKFKNLQKETFGSGQSAPWPGNALGQVQFDPQEMGSKTRATLQSCETGTGVKKEITH
jgi:hypothetical protein